MNPAVLIVDEGGVVTGANQPALALFVDAVGKPVIDVVRGADGARADFSVSGRGVVGSSVVDVIVTPLAPSGRSLVLLPVSDGGRDQVRQMAASVGHGLRNPLGAVRNAWFYVAKRVRPSDVAKSDPRIGQFLDIVDVELKRCAQVVTDLFEFADIKPAARAPVSLASMIGDVARELRVPIVNDVDETLPVVHIDGPQVRQAIVSLVQNAFDAGATRVIIGAQLDGEDVVVDVEDDGPGVPAAERARLFDPLYTTKLKGTGLGLALVDAVARAHGGRVSVSDAEPHGAIFRLRLGQGAPR